MKDPTYPETPIEPTAPRDPVNPEQPERVEIAPNPRGRRNRAGPANPANSPPPESPTTTPAPSPMESAATPITPVATPAYAASTGTTVGMQRPGLVTFAAVMMFVLAGFELTFAIVEFANAAWVAVNVEGSFGGPLWAWGVIDLILAGAAIYAGYDILRGGEFGRVFGLIIATLSAIRWFFYLPAAPLMAIVVIAVDVLIIYGLAANWEFFRAAQAGRRRATV